MDKDTTIGRRPGGTERAHECGAAAPGRGGRMSRQRKLASVLRLLRGEDLEEVSRSLGVTAATFTGWRDAFLAAGGAVPTTKHGCGGQRIVGHRARVRAAFHGEGHRKVWARLRHCGIWSSLRRVLRLMRENELLAPGRVGSPRGPRTHDGTIIAETVDTMWGTDLTTTFTGEGPVAVFVAVAAMAVCRSGWPPARPAAGEDLESDRLKARPGAALLGARPAKGEDPRPGANRPLGRRRHRP